MVMEFEMILGPRDHGILSNTSIFQFIFLKQSLGQILKPFKKGYTLLREILMKEYATLIIGIATSSIQLNEEVRNYELIHIYFFKLSSFYGMPNEDLLIFIRDVYSMM